LLNNLLLLAQLGPRGLRGAPITPQSEPVAKITEAVEAAAAAPDNGLTILFLYFTVFMLAVFVGFEIITKVPPTLHTPLMSGSNAISGITLIGAMVMAGSDQGIIATLFAFISIILATMNVVGGFLVTHRMLEMFQKKK
jgi:NAD(P) transhydrogenase subunit alpha